jgi:hypothetical protein
MDGQTESSNEALGKATHLRQGYGAPSIEGKAAMAAASELGSEGVSNERECMSQLASERVSKSPNHPPRCCNVVALQWPTKAVTRISNE